MSSSTSRRGLFHRASALAVASALLGPQSAHAFSMPSGEAHTMKQASSVGNVGTPAQQQTVAYRSLSLNMNDFGVRVPVAMWHPVDDFGDGKMAEYSRVGMFERNDLIKYDHRISVKKIGQLLAGWEFIPEFAQKEFQLDPTMGSIVDGTRMPMPSRGPVVFLAHGYLGSRFDLSHLAEALAQEGFICISAEFPESLAASYPRFDGLDRSVIMSNMLDTLSSDWGIKSTSFGVVGHSLGCGTAVNTGDESWARVCIAGFPRNRDGSTISGNKILFLTSMNDGAVSLSRFGGRSAIPSEYVQLEESTLSQLSNIPSKAALLFDRPDAPNHISFLTDGVNDAMINLLSPLLPVAQAMNIPVLDFDKYKDSRDSKQTADVVIPLVTSYLKQHMA